MQEASLKRLKIRNFKSFADLDVEFKEFNVLVGANAAGKSNFAQIFKFVKDVRGGLADALAMQGGAEYVLNFDGGSRMSMELEIDFPHNPKISSLPNPRRQLYNTRGVELRAGGGQEGGVRDPVRCVAVLRNGGQTGSGRRHLVRKVGKRKGVTRAGLSSGRRGRKVAGPVRDKDTHRQVDFGVARGHRSLVPVGKADLAAVIRKSWSAGGMAQ